MISGSVVDDFFPLDFLGGGGWVLMSERVDSGGFVRRWKRYGSLTWDGTRMYFCWRVETVSTLSFMR